MASGKSNPPGPTMARCWAAARMAAMCVGDVGRLDRLPLVGEVTPLWTWCCGGDPA